ncbi:MAG: S41 family peptidase [Prevotella sp.]|nr:S41 family peptidase [Prevotella sp.]
MNENRFLCRTKAHGRKAAVCALVLLCSVTALAQQRMTVNPEALRKLQMAEVNIANKYVDSVDEKKLIEDAIRGMLEKLDPHSTYSTPKETKDMNEPLQGNFEGIGVQFNMVEDTLLVIQTITGGPSEKVGIMAGDRIVAVNDTAIAGVKMARDEIVRRLRGPKGTKVLLGVVRRGIGEQLKFTVVRDKIPVKTVDAYYMLTPTIGYIRIGSFGAQTHAEFCECMENLRRSGMRDLVLDLQENGGGYLQASVDIANEFLDKDDLIVYTEGRRTRRREYRAAGNGMFAKGRVVVLVDSYTASAAEIVSGAVQDNDRGTIVGRRTFGKGLVQEPIFLPDGSMIRLTTAHYYSPSGRCIQKPYEKGKQKDYAMDVANRLKSGELMSADSVHFADSLKYYTLRKHRVVYGGGGIMPDEFIPLDTTKYTRFHRELSAKSILINNSLRYIDKNRKQLLKQYKKFDDFRRSFEIPQSVIDDIMAEGEKQKVRPKDDDELQRTLPQLRRQLKALAARDLWSMSEYFCIINENSDAVQRALKLLGE